MTRNLVKRRETVVIPLVVQQANQVASGLNYVFLVWSILTIIFYFADVSLPSGLEIGLSISAIVITVAHKAYWWWQMSASEIKKISPVTSHPQGQPEFDSLATIN
jgi:hypothetical protein